MRPLPLTRAANLCDFDGICASAATWQQLHARDAYTRWRYTLDRPQLRAGDRVVCYNWGAGAFTDPTGGELSCDAYDSMTTSVLPDGSYTAIFALSVLDRVDEPLRFLKTYRAALIPGGLLVATFALWDVVGPDVALGADLRRRIYNRDTWRKLIIDGRNLRLQTFGGVDLRYPGDTLGDHSLGTIVLTKEPA